MEFLYSLVDWFIPEDTRQDVDKYRRAKLIVWLTLINVILYVLNIVKWMKLEVPALAFSLTCTALLQFAMAFTLKKTGSIKIAGSGMLLGFSWHFTFLPFLTGGLESGSIGWILTVPLLAVLVIGTRGGMVFSAYVSIVLIYFIYAKKTGVEMMRVDISEAEQTTALIAGVCGSFIAVVLCGILFETGQKSAFKLQQESSREALESADEMKRIIERVNDGSQKLAGSAGELKLISISMKDEAKTTSSQAVEANLASKDIAEKNKVFAESIEKLNESIKQIEENTRDAVSVGLKAVDLSEETSAVIGELGKSSAEIAKVSEVIFTIARQTNLLSLNAAIEAAKAGDSGKGFAVVAGAVKTLAVKTTSATSDITQKIESIQGKTKTAIRAIAEINEITHQIDALQKQISQLVDSQAGYSGEMRSIAGEVADRRSSLNENIKKLADSAVHTSDAVSEILDSASGLNSLATDLSQVTNTKNKLGFENSERQSA